MTDDLPLGRPVPFPTTPDRGVLHPVDRAPARARIGFGDPPPCHGEDVWNAYELTWLGPEGRPRIGVLTLRVPCASPRMAESKSFKLYLGGFAQTRFESRAEVEALVAEDVAAIVGCPVAVDVTPPSNLAPIGDWDAFCLDELPVPITRYEVSCALLATAPGHGGDSVCTHLFRSICPVTGQPDHGSIAIAWRGRQLDRGALLAYLVSYRTSTGFHEDIVERIFVDIRDATTATWLAVEGRFLRRGGIDINPLRSTSPPRPAPFRLPRQ